MLIYNPLRTHAERSTVFWQQGKTTKTEIALLAPPPDSRKHRLALSYIRFALFVPPLAQAHRHAQSAATGELWAQDYLFQLRAQCQAK